MASSVDYIKHFTRIYETCEWADNKDPLYRGSSGGGSTVEYNKDAYVPFVRQFIADNGVRSVADLGCGDFACGPLIYDDLDVVVHGYDAYAAVVEANQARQGAKYTFTHLDFVHQKEDIEPADLCILKDVLQHLLIVDIYAFLDYLMESRKFKYILVCNCCGQTKHNPVNIQLSTGLSCEFFPLKRYRAQKMLLYGTKEVSLITCG
jgi:hypothetical protein